jgi:hypothetical protein
VIDHRRDEAETSLPVVSVMYLPTTPLELASPCGNCDDLELSSSAPTRTRSPRARRLRGDVRSSPLLLSMYDTPVASRRCRR